MSDPIRPRLGVVLANLGTPDAPTPAAVRRYLREFLSDPRIIEMSRLAWWFILHLFILPWRPRRVARLYQSIWEKGDSPMRRILRAQCQSVASALQQTLPQADILVRAAMSYGHPALSAALDDLQRQGVENIVILPLFPQYSATSTAAVYDAVGRWLTRQRNLPAISLLKDYYDHPAYIAALAASVREFRAQYGTSSKLLFSFHGIPQRYANNGDPYPSRCRETARRVAVALGLRDDDWACSFQSRFGAQAWVQPYTDMMLREWAHQGITSVQVLCPAFSADCLETLEEIAGQNREGFLLAGGKSYAYIPALNTRDDHITLLVDLIKPHLQAFLRS
jgi:ferrochelatase